jgi:lauroyl/myristoyl acyltransferase
MARVRSLLPDLKPDSSFWRKAIRAGAVHGPDAFIRHSPAIFGLAFAAALPKVRHAVAENLRRAQGRAPLGHIARVFTSYASSLTEAFAVGSGRSERIVATIRGDSRFRTAKDLKKGVIVATAHTSGWYAAGPVLGSVYDDEVLVVMQRERDQRAEDIQEQSRRELGQRVVYVGDDPLAAMPLLAHLKKGGIVALQMDRVPKGARGRAVEFLGRPHELPDGPFTLAALSGAPIVVVLGRRVGFLEYEIQVGEPVSLPRRPSQEEIDRAAARVAASIEAFVRLHPTDWFQFSSARGPT